MIPGFMPPLGNRLVAPGGAPAPWVADIYVDSVAGDDANAGTEAEPKQTLGATKTAADLLGTAANIALVRGSAWNNDGYTRTQGDDVRAVGAGAVPVIDASIAVTVWTPEGTDNVWQADVTHDGLGTDRIRVYMPDGTRLARVATAATCGSTAGSFVEAWASQANPLTVKIHPVGSVDPNDLGMRVTARKDGLVLGSGADVLGPLIARRAMSNNGAVVCLAPGNFEKVLVVDGSKHHLVLGSGARKDIVACRMDTATANEGSIVTFTDFLPTNATESTVTWDRCGASADLGGTRTSAATYIQHTGDSTNFGNFVGSRLWSVEHSTGWIPGAFVARIKGHYSRNNNTPFNCFTDDGIFEYFQDRKTVSGIQIVPKDISGTGVVEFKNCVFYEGAQNGASTVRPDSASNGMTIKFTNCIFYGATFVPSFIGFTNWTSGALQVNNCIFSYHAIGNPIQVPSGVTYTGNNNVYLCNRTTNDNLNFTHHGTEYDTIATLFAATGQDENSLLYGINELGELWSGTVADGDFRLGGTGAGAAAAALGAGCTHHLNWNTNTEVAGAPTRWPVVPETLAQCETYISDPDAHDFYPA